MDDVFQDQVLNEILFDKNLKKNHVVKQVKLEALPNKKKKAAYRYSIEPFKNGLSGAIHHDAQRSNLAPINFKDHNQMNDWMYKASNVSGYFPDKPEIFHSQLTNSEIAANVSEYQLKGLKESSSMKMIMQNVIKLHESLKEIVTANLMHRKGLSAAVERINDQYIQKFEEMLVELLKTQRMKFKV